MKIKKTMTYREVDELITSLGYPVRLNSSQTYREVDELITSLGYPVTERFEVYRRDGWALLVGGYRARLLCKEIGENAYDSLRVVGYPMDFPLSMFLDVKTKDIVTTCLKALIEAQDWE